MSNFGHMFEEPVEDIPAEDASVHLNMNFVLEKCDKRFASYILRMCIAQCAKACLELKLSMSPASYVSVFQYGPLLNDLLHAAVTDKNVMIEYNEIITNRMLKLARNYGALKERLDDIQLLMKTCNEPQSTAEFVEESETALAKMREIKTIYNNINNNIHNADYLYNNRLNCTIDDTINKILESTLYNPNYRETIISLIEKHFGSRVELVEGNYDINRIKMICKELHLTEDMGKLIMILWVFDEKIESPNVVIAKMIGITNNKFIKCLEKLNKLGLVTCYGTDVITMCTDIKLSNTVQTFINSHSKSFANHLLSLYQSKDPIKLTINDYPENIQEKIKNVITLINNHDGKKPCNILLYGKSGSGKSSLINYLQNVIHKQFCAISEENLKKYFDAHKTSEDHRKEIDEKQEQLWTSSLDSDSASERLSQLKLCDALPVHSDYVFIMDECDDSINNPQSDYDCWLTGKKQLNELLENLKTPTIWIANHTNRLDESTCRRFAYSIKFDDLNFKQRTKIWKNQIKYTQTESYMKNVDIEQLAIKYKISAGLINSILQSVKTLKPSSKKVLSVIDNFAKSHCDLIGIDCNSNDNRKSEHSVYSIDGLNIKSNFQLKSIEEGLMIFYKQLLDKSNKNRNVNILLDGVPGAGKTEYAKYLARYLDAPLITCHGSDFLGMYVGETEKNIKKIFTEAEQTKSILFIDEADGLIHQRGHAQRSWEVTQVNEFLCNMERFNGILICATNFVKNMDDASIRRFSFKVTFDYLNNDGKLQFFKRFFDQFGTFDYKQVKEQLDNIDCLVPGDFKVVRDRCNFLKGGKVDLEFIINELKDEVSHKPQYVKSKHMGF